MKLFVSGQKTGLDLVGLSPLMKKVKNFLDKSKDGELFTVLQIAAALGYRSDSISNESPTLRNYWHVAMGSGVRRKYWGKPATVAQLKRETSNESQRRRTR